MPGLYKLPGDAISRIVKNRKKRVSQNVSERTASNAIKAEMGLLLGSYFSSSL